MYKYLYNITFYKIILAVNYIKKIKVYINTVYTDYKNSKFIKK